MAQTKFYRGVDKSSLPENRRDGAIYIIDTGENSGTNSGRGEMYVDIGSRRLQISPPSSAANIVKYSEASIAEIGGTTSSLGYIYLITSNSTGEEIGYKIGDGNAFIRDLPFTTFISNEEKINLQKLTNNSVSVAVSSIQNSEDLKLEFSKAVNIS